MISNDIKFRCSSLGYIMTEPRTKSELLSETCKAHLIDVFVSAKYSRREEAQSKFLDKGNDREEDSITLLSRVSKSVYKKNNQRIENEYITGEPDIYEGNSIMEADVTLDTKTSWSAHTFFRAKINELNKMYFYQGQGYMAITGAKLHKVAFCLVNGLPTAINDEKRRLQWKSTKIDFESDPVYIEKCKQVEINHIFCLKEFAKENPGFVFHNDLENWNYDIPMQDRLYVFEIKRDEEVIKNIYVRVQQCRDWLNSNMFTKATL